MSTYTLESIKSALLKPTMPTTNYSSGTTAILVDEDYNEDNYFIVGYESPPLSLLYNRIIALTPYYYVYASSRDSGMSIKVGALGSSWEESTVTCNQGPSWSSLGWESTDYLLKDDCPGWAESDPLYDINALLYGTIVAGNYPGDIATSRYSGKAPYLVVHYDETIVAGVIRTPAPISGYIPKTAANTFSWAIGKSGICVGAITQTGATFKWRTGAETTPSTISCGTVMSCNVPANTFVTDSIQWQVDISLSSGDTITSDWFTLSTIEVVSTATIVSPKNSVLDGSQPTRFEWLHSISTGTSQTKADLQISTDGVNWSSLATVNGDPNYYIAPANLFSAGNLYWRARTYNTDNAASAWSEAASCIVVAAPVTPAVSATQTPRPLVSWQSSNQQAFQVQVGDFNSGARFGTDLSYKSQTYLPDGTHVARVRVQNKYGLWSDWGSCSVVVENTSSSSISLTATGTYIASLFWSGGDYDIYAIYRDNVLIAKTTTTAYIDNFSIGLATYQVIGIYEDSDNYSLSNSASVVISPKVTMIADLSAMNWTELRYTQSAATEQSFALSRNVTYRHFAGSAYPSAETSEFYDKVMEISTVFTTRADAMAFESMFGKVVCLKSRNEEMVIGVLHGLDKVVGDFFTAYSFAVRQIQWEEVVAL